MTTQNLLVELFVEELPPKALKRLGEAFAELIRQRLGGYGLLLADSVVTAYASPRRLAAHITHVASKDADAVLTQKVLPTKVGMDAHQKPSDALKKKLASFGLPADMERLVASYQPPAVLEPVQTAEARMPLQQLFSAMDGNVEMLFYKRRVPGKTLADGLQQALSDVVNNLPIPKLMTYQLADGWSDVKFVRPAHGLVALHGSAVVPVEMLGLKAGNTTHGHRFEALQDPITLPDADSYADKLLQEGAVIASFAQRRAEIVRQLAAAAAKVGGGVRPIDDAALLDEVTALVERPNVLVCSFERAFLEVPQECLILTMKANQKYFPLLDAQGKLTHQFLVVSNISPQDPSAVIGGNERVIRPRLADAKFFYDQDRKKTLASRAEGLAKVVYHNKLGSQAERAERVRDIAHAITEQLRAAATPYTAQARSEFDMLAFKAEQAARLAKADLLTDMVGEFPELQGIMGGYYARHEGLRDGVAIAIEDHYKPRFAGDSLPRNHTGLVVALADKLETLVGMFGIGNLPTGDRDPFALRRHALGVIRILMEKSLPLSLDTLLASAVPVFGAL
ncbi:MAG: glycine--tRNA ligase subunit beta, partial [Burkholderiaceae bacterium]